ncbi:MAG: DUF4013 domain-containing protein [Methanobacterium sp.]
MNLINEMWDSFKYTTSGLTKVVFIGILLFIIDQIDELSWIGPYATTVEYILIIVSFTLAFLAAGYIFRIIEETIKGSKKPPKFNRLKEMAVHGIKEIFVAFIYAIIPLALFFVVTGNFDIFGVRETLYLAVNFTLEQQYLDELIILDITIGLILDILLVVAILNMALHNGSIRSAFAFKTIFKKIKRIGLVKLIVVDVIIICIFLFDWFILSNTLAEGLSWIGFLISQLLISPFIIVFTARLIGLINK